MWLLCDKFLGGSQPMIANFMTDILCSQEIMMQDDATISIEDRVGLCKSILKMMQEMTHNLDQRIQFDGRL